MPIGTIFFEFKISDRSATNFVLELKECFSGFWWNTDDYSRSFTYWSKAARSSSWEK